jgi:Ca2+-binding RTX toxin-like protein
VVPTRLSLELLEAREVPAFVTSFSHGQLIIRFDNAPTGQSVQVSAYQGKVTLNEQLTAIRTERVAAITVIGSDLDNTIDLHFVSTQTGFRRLDGKVVIKGGGGNDVLMGSQFSDRLYGGTGFDQIFGGAGNDVVDGGPGIDWLYPGPGNDQVFIGPGDWTDRLEPGDVVHYV